MSDEILHRVEDSVSWIVLNRPEARNAITPDGRDRVIELLEDASRELGVRCVVLTGTGDAFCSGADLRARRDAPPRPEGAPAPAAGEVARVIREGAQRLVAAILDCEKPVIAAVNGVAAGIGAHMALACDLVVARGDARFIEVFVRRGLVPDGGGAWLLPRLVGLQRAKELMFLGDDLSVTDAARMGLVNLIVEDEDLEPEVRRLAERLASGPTRAIALAKKLLNTSLDVDRATAFAMEADAQEQNMTTNDAQEGVRSFVERREPEFRGW